MIILYYIYFLLKTNVQDYNIKATKFRLHTFRYHATRLLGHQVSPGRLGGTGRLINIAVMLRF